MNLKRLSDFFHPNDIEWRIQQAGFYNGNPWAMVLAYVTNRAIMDRLDEVCGPQAWKNDFRPGPAGGVLCGISIKIGDEWVTKWDGADNTEVEKIKGGLSSSMKRAAVQWGIGRYLYKFPEGFAVFTESGMNKAKIKDSNGKFHRLKWNPPAFPTWALPKNEMSENKNNSLPELYKSIIELINSKKKNGSDLWTSEEKVNHKKNADAIKNDWDKLSDFYRSINKIATEREVSF